MNGATNALCALLILGSLAGFPAEALAQSYPSKPIRIVVSGAPGGSPDLVIKALNTSAVQEGMATIGNEPRGTSPLELATFIDDYMKQIREVVRISGVKLED